MRTDYRQFLHPSLTAVNEALWKECSTCGDVRPLTEDHFRRRALTEPEQCKVCLLAASHRVYERQRRRDEQERREHAWIRNANMANRGARAKAAHTLYDLYVRPGERLCCEYCGGPPETIDHVTPLAYMTSLPSFDDAPRPLMLVHSCRECNAISSARVFKTYSKKRDWIRKRLRKRYRHLLRIPKWSDHELAQLAGATRADVGEAILLAHSTRQRLSYGSHRRLVKASSL